MYAYMLVFQVQKVGEEVYSRIAGACSTLPQDLMLLRGILRCIYIIFLFPTYLPLLGVLNSSFVLAWLKFAADREVFG